MCRPPTNFTSFLFREREQFLSDGRLNRRERRGDIFKAFALGVDAEEPSHETPKNHHPGSWDIALEERNAVAAVAHEVSENQRPHRADDLGDGEEVGNCLSPNFEREDFTDS